MRLRHLIAVSFVVGGTCAVFVACTDLSGLTGESPDASANEAGGGDGSTLDAASADDGDAGTAEASTDAARCPDAAGSAMVARDGFCIDATEVTMADYFAFTVVKGEDAGGQPTACVWNSSYVPSNLCPFVASSSLPVVGVDWCDAHAYCEWAGKRLCGKIGGGDEVDVNNGAVATNQWFHACSAGGAQLYPYGKVYDPLKCNGRDRDAGGTLAVATTGCEGPAGVWDMSGNVQEWTALCGPPIDGGSPGKDRCARRGGDYGEDPATLSCSGINHGDRNGRFCYTGFRCCADLAP